MHVEGVAQKFEDYVIRRRRESGVTTCRLTRKEFHKSEMEQKEKC